MSRPIASSGLRWRCTRAQHEVLASRLLARAGRVREKCAPSDDAAPRLATARRACWPLLWALSPLVCTTGRCRDPPLGATELLAGDITAGVVPAPEPIPDPLGGGLPDGGRDAPVGVVVGRVVVPPTGGTVTVAAGVVNGPAETEGTVAVAGNGSLAVEGPIAWTGVGVDGWIVSAEAWASTRPAPIRQAQIAAAPRRTTARRWHVLLNLAIPLNILVHPARARARGAPAVCPGRRSSRLGRKNPGVETVDERSTRGAASLVAALEPCSRRSPMPRMERNRGRPTADLGPQRRVPRHQRLAPPVGKRTMGAAARSLTFPPCWTADLLTALRSRSSTEVVPPH